jgi:TM2 domain-containing membrane protein YozV
MAVRLDPFRRIVNVAWPSAGGRLLQAWTNEVATPPAGFARRAFHLLLEPFDSASYSAGGVPLGGGSIFRFTIGGIARTMNGPFGSGFAGLTAFGDTGFPATAVLADGRNIFCANGYADVFISDNVVYPILDQAPTLVELIRPSDSFVLFSQDVSAWATLRTVAGSFPTSPGNAQNYRLMP